MKRRSLFGGLLAGGAAVVAAKVAPAPPAPVPAPTIIEDDILWNLRRDLDEAMRRLDVLSQPINTQLPASVASPPPIYSPISASIYGDVRDIAWYQTVTMGNSANANDMITFNYRPPTGSFGGSAVRSDGTTTHITPMLPVVAANT